MTEDSRCSVTGSVVASAAREMAFGPKAGCPMCGIVAAAAGDVLQSARAADARQDILWRDDNFTAYREQVHPVSSKAHVIIAFKWVCPPSISYYHPDASTVSTFLRCTHWYVSEAMSTVLGYLTLLSVLE